MNLHTPVTVKYFGTACCTSRAMGATCKCSYGCRECVNEATRWAFNGGNASYRLDYQRRRHSEKCAANS